MILGIPVMDSHDWTRKTVESLARTVRGPLGVVIVDNASEEPYTREEFGKTPFPLLVRRYEKNLGYYAPLWDLATSADEAFDFYEWDYKDRTVGLMHNDLTIYEEGWDVRMAECFREDPKLGLVGFVGSYEVDENGGRGGGTMCHFTSHSLDGNLVGQSQDAGERIVDLRPSLVLDSLFMAFRREAIRDVSQDENDLPLAHFYDRIWPLRLVRAGWRVGTLGVEVSHWGGITIVLHPRFQSDCKEWCWGRGVREVPHDDWHLQMYKEGERRLLEEFKSASGLVPSQIRRDWIVTDARGAIYGPNRT